MATKRTAVSKKVYLDAEGKDAGRSVPENVSGLEFRFTNGETRKVVAEEFPENIQIAAMWHGFAQKLGDSYASSESVDAAVGSFEEMYNQLLEGDWITAAEGGAPRVTQLALAYANAVRSSGAEITDEDAVAKVKTWDADKRKAAAEVPEVATALAELRLAAAKAKLAAAKAALKEKGPTQGLGDL